MSPITLDAKRAGARSAGNPLAACEAAGAGNGVTDPPSRARRGKPRIQTRKILRTTAPVLDPTAVLEPFFASGVSHIGVSSCPISNPAPMPELTRKPRATVLEQCGARPPRQGAAHRLSRAARVGRWAPFRFTPDGLDDGLAFTAA
jgi:hypothetical protein